MTDELRVSALLDRGRRLAESLMQDTFQAYAPGARTTGDDGIEVEGYEPQGATIGKISGSSRQSSDTQARTVTVGDSELVVVEGGLHLPLTSEAPAMGRYGRGWEYELTSLGPNTDSSLLGSRWLVVDAPAKSYATARRLNAARLK